MTLKEFLFTKGNIILERQLAERCWAFKFVEQQLKIHKGIIQLCKSCQQLKLEQMQVANWPLTGGKKPKPDMLAS